MHQKFPYVINTTVYNLLFICGWQRLRKQQLINSVVVAGFFITKIVQPPHVSVCNLQTHESSQTGFSFFKSNRHGSRSQFVHLWLLRRTCISLFKRLASGQMFCMSCLYFMMKSYASRKRRRRRRCRLLTWLKYSVNAAVIVNSRGKYHEMKEQRRGGVKRNLIILQMALTMKSYTREHLQ